MVKDKGISNPHYLEHRTRLRNRFIENGVSGLQDYEVIELFLTFVIPQKDVKEAAKQALRRFGTIKGIFDADEKDLQEIPYFKDKALALRKFIIEVSKLYQYQAAKDVPISLSKEELLKHCIKKLGTEKEEQFWMISLDSKHSIIKENLISKGLADKTPVYPRQVIETAMKNGAYFILLLHNHPNGHLQASEQDITITKAIDIPARVLNMFIYDHIIVAGEQYFSFRDSKLL